MTRSKVTIVAINLLVSLAFFSSVHPLGFLALWSNLRHASEVKSEAGLGHPVRFLGSQEKNHDKVSLPDDDRKDGSVSHDKESKDAGDVHGDGGDPDDEESHKDHDGKHQKPHDDKTVKEDGKASLSDDDRKDGSVSHDRKSKDSDDEESHKDDHEGKHQKPDADKTGKEDGKGKHGKGTKKEDEETADLQIPKSGVVYPEEFYRCVDDTRVHVDFTNATCVTRAMLVAGSGSRQSFYLVCGAEAMLRKDVEFKSIVTVGNQVLTLILYATLSGTLPLLLSSLVFQSLNSKPSTHAALSQSEDSQASCWTTCKKTMGQCGMAMFLPVIVCINLYTTGMTTRRLVFELIEFYNTLTYGPACNFDLFLAYASQGEILEVLLLAMFSWSDLLFNCGKLLGDCLQMCCCCCWSAANECKYFLCCKCIPWHLLKVLCCCFGPMAWCKMFGSLILTECMVILCIIPVMIVALLLFIVLAFLLAYSMGGLALVLLVYSFAAMVAVFVVLALVYILSIIPALITGHFQTPQEFFEGSIERLKKELSDPPFKEGEDPGVLTLASKIVRSKVFAVFLPWLTLGILMAMQIASSFFIQTYAQANVDMEKAQNLAVKVAGDWKLQLQSIQQGIVGSFAQTNAFVYKMLIQKILQIPSVVHTVEEYLDPVNMLIAVSTLFDLASKFEQLQKAVFALRIGSGLLMGPLQLFELLAKYDVAK